VAGYFKGVSWEGLCAEVEDILLSERNYGSRRSGGRAACAKRSEREQGREIAYKKVQVLTKISRNRVL